MAVAADELMLLERVFLRLGSAETDEQLQNVLCKFLPPVLLKLSSPQEGVRKKVMELLIHVNKRLKTRPQVQLPMEALLTQYQDPAATSFVTNFTIIYIKTGFPRLSVEKQAELVPTILSALENKPQSHLDGLLLQILPLLDKVKVPSDPSRVTSLFGLNERPQISKHLLGLMLDMLLLPYGALPTTDNDQSGSNNVLLPVPPGMSENSFKRITNNNPMKPEELENIKLGIVRFLAHGVFKDEDILIHLIISAADTRFSVANLADNELKKVVGSVDWNSATVSGPLFSMYLGSQAKNVKPDEKKSAASTRIRLKLLVYLCRLQKDGLLFPASIQVIFDSLFGVNTNTKLKTLALNFTMNLIRFANDEPLSKVAPVLLSGMNKLINEGEEVHQAQVYTTIGMIGQKFPKMVYHDVALLEKFYKSLETANPELKLQIREALINLLMAYKYDIFPEEADKDGRLSILFALIKFQMNSEEGMVRFVGVRTLATIFPPDHVPSKFLLLLSTGDLKDEVSAEALKSLYGTSRNSEVDLAKKTKIVMPKFEQITKYVYTEAEMLVKDNAKKITIGNHVLPFNLKTYSEIITFLRLCLIRTLDVPLTREILTHPCEFSPVIRQHLQSIFDGTKPIEHNALLQYFSLIKNVLLVKPCIRSFSCMVELVGCLPQLIGFISNDVQWVHDHLNSMKEEIREFASVLYSLIMNTVDLIEFKSAIEFLINQTTGSKMLEVQHGAILAIGNCLSLKLIDDRTKIVDDIHERFVTILFDFLKHQNPLLVGAACSSLGELGRCGPLPLSNGVPKNGSPDAKRPNTDTITKIDVVNQLTDVMNNSKIPAKVREKAAKALGLICVGEEEFVHTHEVLRSFLNTAKETKDVEVHFTIGESLVMCCKGVWAPEARNYWTTLAGDYRKGDDGEMSNENLEWLLNELFKLANMVHPNSRQASCIWLLAVLKGCGEKEPITNKLQLLQNTFMDLLCENNDIVQDAASKGLCVVYDIYKSDDLLEGLVRQLTSGARQTVHVTSDTKLFEEGQLGRTPTGNNLTTYKELCSLASDLNKPDLIYQFMHLANHNAVWNSKKGAAFGFSSIAEKCGESLKVHLPLIIPKLYRYQFDPTPNIQASMHNIWRVLVAEPQKMLDQYYDEILDDLLANLNSNEYRVRQSCCMALQDFLKGSGNRSIHDCISRMDELWMKLFRVMDDHHEPTRLTAIKTGRVLSRLCIRGCDQGQGNAGSRMVEAVLPPLLDHGITSPVAEIRLVSLQTISELVGSAGKQLKPSLPKLIPALLQATGELESAKLSYLSTMLGAQSQAQEAVDSARASFAKSHFTTETVAKSLQYADSSILEELVPKIVDLLKSNVGLGTRIACTHFITLLVVQLSQDIQSYTGKFLAALVNGLTDRNAAIRKHYASTIGHLVSTAKESSLEKLFAKLQHWYFEREDDAIRSAIALTIQSIGIHNQEILKGHSDVILPLVFFAMHADKTEETENTNKIWTEVWSEHSPGTETGIRQNLAAICNMLKMALESPSWTMKAQAANAVATIANKLGTTMDGKHRNSLISILLNGLSGRTWNGKDKLLKALASICAHCKDVIKEDKEVDLTALIDAVIKESRKEEIVYKISALECLGEILSALEVDKFNEVYTIIQDILVDDDDKNNRDDAAASEDVAKNRENLIKLKEMAYETLGKTWPKNGQATQEQYREMFVEHCVHCLPKITRSIQVSVVAALYNYIDKLILFVHVDGANDEEALGKITDNILIALRYGIGISKHTRLRKESLNAILCLAKKLKHPKQEKEFMKLKTMFIEVLDDISGDNQPEIKSRVIDIKNILC